MSVSNDETSSPLKRFLNRLKSGLKWFRPSALALGLILFAFPFVAVACDTPGGFGHVGQGGTTSYTGYGLATGGEPNRTTENLLPIAESQDDLIGLQPMMTIALVLLVAAIICAIAFKRVQTRRLVSFIIAAATLASASVGVALAYQQVLLLVTQQLEGRDLPSGAEPADYVGIETGFWLFAILLGLIVIIDVIQWLVGRRGTANEVESGA